MGLSCATLGECKDEQMTLPSSHSRSRKGDREVQVRQGSTSETWLFNMMTGVRAKCQGGSQCNLLKTFLSEARWKEVLG